MNPVLGAALPPMDFDDPRVAEMLAGILEAKISEQVGLRVPALRIGAVQDVLADGSVVVQAHGPGNDGTPMPFLGGTPTIGELVRTYRWAQSRGTTPSYWAEPLTSVSPSARGGYYPGKVVLDLERDYKGRPDGSRDNADRLKAAIADAKAAGGAVIYMGPGTWVMGDPVTHEDASDVLIMGDGPSQTTWAYGGTDTDCALRLRTVNGTLTKVTGAGVLNMTIDLANVANYGLKIKTVNSSLFSNLVIQNAVLWQLYADCWDTRPGGGDARDNQENVFERLILDGGATGGALRVTGNDVTTSLDPANTSLNRFDTIWAKVQAGDAFSFGNADGNVAVHLRVYQSSGAGKGLVLNAGPVAGKGHARHNLFFGLQTATAGVFALAGVQSSGPNFIFGFSLGNGGSTHLPTISAGATLVYISDDGTGNFAGVTFGAVGDIAASAVGDAGAAGATAKVADAGHVHARETFAAAGGLAASAPGDAAAAGSGSQLPHANHVHAREAYGLAADITTSAVGDAAAAGALSKVANAGHTHGRETFAGAGGIVAIGTAAAGGSGTQPPHANHVHPLVGAAVQAARLSLASIAAAGTHTDTVTWPTAFADANYTAVISYVQTTLAAHHVTGAMTATPIAASISVRTANEDTSARTPVLHAIAIHD